jgi:hypothetical protein
VYKVPINPNIQSKNRYKSPKHATIFYNLFRIKIFSAYFKLTKAVVALLIYKASDQCLLTAFYFNKRGVWNQDMAIRPLHHMYKIRSRLHSTIAVLFIEKYSTIQRIIQSAYLPCVSVNIRILNDKTFFVLQCICVTLRIKRSVPGWLHDC